MSDFIDELESYYVIWSDYLKKYDIDHNEIRIACEKGTKMFEELKKGRKDLIDVVFEHADDSKSVLEKIKSSKDSLKPIFNVSDFKYENFKRLNLGDMIYFSIRG